MTMQETPKSPAIMADATSCRKSKIPLPSFIQIRPVSREIRENVFQTQYNKFVAVIFVRFLGDNKNSLNHSRSY